jgi:hypothetical protein
MIESSAVSVEDGAAEWQAARMARWIERVQAHRKARDAREVAAVRARMQGMPEPPPLGRAEPPPLLKYALDCWDDGTQYVAWCTYCHVWHLHGRQEGSRVPHCMYYGHDSLPRGWYSLRPVGLWTDEVERVHADEAKRGHRLFRRWADRGGREGRVTFAEVWAEAEAKRVAPKVKQERAERGDARIPRAPGFEPGPYNT